MVSVEIVKRYPAFALDVRWEAQDGVVGLFGPSGAGKTLTLQCLAGLVTPDAGRIVVDGRVFFDAATGVSLPPQARRVGYVFQGYALFPHLSVAENVAFGLRGRPRAERASITHKTNRLSVPLWVNYIQGIFKHSGIAVIVFWCNNDKRIPFVYFFRPLFDNLI